MRLAYPACLRALTRAVLPTQVDAPSARDGRELEEADRFGARPARAQVAQAHAQRRDNIQPSLLSSLSCPLVSSPSHPSLRFLLVDPQVLPDPHPSAAVTEAQFNLAGDEMSGPAMSQRMVGTQRNAQKPARDGLNNFAICDADFPWFTAAPAAADTRRQPPKRPRPTDLG